MLPTKALYLIMNEAMPKSIQAYKECYETRLIAQKFIYLFDQIWGEDLYNHSWYLAGPYSSTLTHQIYEELIPNLEGSREEWDGLTLSDDVIKTIKQVHALVENVKAQAQGELSESEAYELVASIWYMAKGKKNRDKLDEELLFNKPHFKKINNLGELIKLVTEKMASVQ